MADHEHDSKKSHGHGGGGHGHGGSHEEHHEGAPEWLISFADNTALMMGFFVIMLALTMKQLMPSGPKAAEGSGGTEIGLVNEDTAALDWAISVRAAFNNPVDIHSTNPAEAALVQRLRERLGQGQARDPGQKGQHDEVQSIRPTAYIGAGGVVRFGDQDHDLTPAGRVAVAEIAARLRGRSSIIEVRGHTSAAESYRSTDQGFDLSFRRSQSVAAALGEQGVAMSRIRLLAAGSNQRAVAPEYDDDAQQENRRVEVIEMPDRADDAAAPGP